MSNLARRLLLLLLVAASVAARASPPAFVLEDQRERRHDTRAVFGGELATVLIGGDERHTGEGIRDWLKLLPQSARGYRVYGLANLDGVPFFVPRGSIRGGLVEMVPDVPVLCDYDGEVSEALGFPEGLANVEVHHHGRRVGRVSGPASAAKVAEVIALVRTATAGR